MQEPSPLTSRLAIVAALAFSMAVGAAGFMIGRETASRPPARVAAAPMRTPPPIVEEPVEHVLNRAEFLALGDAAADAAASGAPFPTSVAQAPGRRFELHIPFGCEGSAPEGSQAPLRWRYDAEDQALRLHVAPVIWPASDWWQAPPAQIEALEGFWVAHPWSSRETCVPAVEATTPASTEPAPPPPLLHTLGLAEVITKDTPRQLRRAGKPYESVVRLRPDGARLEQGLRMRLRGRIARFPDGNAVRCTQRDGPEQRPVCLVSVTFDEVAIENPLTNDALAAWSPTIPNPGHAVSAR